MHATIVNVYEKEALLNKTSWTIFGVITICIFAVLITVANSNKINVNNIDEKNIISAQPDSGNIGDHVYGKTDSKVVFIEYADFQCSGCGLAYPSIHNIVEKYKDKITYIFRNYPLPSIHPNAKSASAAAEAAGFQGKYWEMHSKLFQSQDDWSLLSGDKLIEKYISYAKDLGLDTAKFNADMPSKEIAQKIDFDTAIGRKVSIGATPSFFVNGVQFDFTTSEFKNKGWDDIAKKIEDKLNEELKKVGDTPLSSSSSPTGSSPTGTDESSTSLENSTEITQ